MSALDDFRRFVTDAESGSQYATWAKQNPGELTRWQMYRDQVLAGGRFAAVPTMTTTHGRELVDAAVLYLDASTPAAPATAPTAPTVFKGCSPGSMIMRASDRVSWELPEIVACFGKGAIVRLDYYGGGSDQGVQDAVNVGLSPLLCIGGTMTTVLSPSAHASVVSAAMTRWKGVVRYIEVGGNEPNINNQTVQTHAALVIAGYDAAKAVDSSVVVLNGGIAPAPNELQFGNDLIPLVKGHIDHFNVHLYEDATARGSWNGWDRSFHPESLGGQPTFRQTLDSNGMQAIPISSTESGGRVTDIGEANQAKYVADAYADFKTRRANGEKVGFLLIYAMRDDDVTGYGLCRADHTRRPAWVEAQKV